MGLFRGIKRSFWRGLAALLPTLLTIVVVATGLSLIQTYAGRHVNWVIVHGAAGVSGLPLDDVAAWYERYFAAWLGVVLAVIGLGVAAYLVGTFLGIYLVRALERWILHIPLLKKIYPGAKQVSEFFFSERRVEFSRVVAVEFPRKDMWMVGFVTGRGFKSLSDHLGGEFVSVFVPSTPAPVTGFVVAVRREEVVDLPISVDEAVQFLISAGVIIPPAERIASLEAALLVQKEGKVPDAAPPEGRT